jgi:hypothetical protein
MGCPHIEMLTGAEIVDEVFTGQMYNFKCGQLVVGNMLGWLIMGRYLTRKINGCLH